VAATHTADSWTNGTFYVHGNHRGDVTAVRSGAVTVGQYDYTAFGEVLSVTGCYTPRFGFSSKEFDRSVGLNYYGYRYLSPALGRFISADPLGLAAGLNCFEFCGSDPIDNIDQYGLWAGWASGEPVSTGESFVPIWGSGRQAINDYSTGHYVWGSVNTVMAVSDLVLVKTVATGVARGAWKTGGVAWSTVRGWMGETGRAEAGQQVHHWAIPRNGWGKEIPDWLKNQPWNLMPMESAELHQAIHGWGELGEFGRFWSGTPDWFKALLISEYGRIGNDFRSGGQHGCK
jgi:RHS repeat-associated protein